jgi:pimeloyl-ACP methyl ester carboxylesterase
MLRCGDRFVEGGLVHGVEWLRTRGRGAEGLVIVPPLIGGHAIQQLRQLRPLVRRNLDLISFNYAGHGESRGDFSLKAALDNSLTALDLALFNSRREGRPLFGLASCFAAVPLLHAVRKRHEPLAGMVLINALPHLRWEKLVYDFCRYWRSSPARRPTFQGVKTALRTYRDDLLPNVRHRRHAFGILSRQRIQWGRVVQDLFTLRHVNSKPLRSTPVLCVYSRQDRLLRQVGFDDWTGYEATIARICPRIQFWRTDGDHFVSGPEVRLRLIETVIRFFHCPGPQAGRRECRR